VDSAVLSRLFDDAAMFPPGNASAETAIHEHLQHRARWYSSLVGPLLVHHGRWEEFVSAHGRAGAPPLRVVVLEPPQHGLDAVPGVQVIGYELPATDPLVLPAGDLPTAVELVDPDRRLVDLARIAAARLAGADVIAKYRTGGTVAAAFPSEEDVVEVIGPAVRLGVPLKFTAGLHHAVRYTDAATGFEHHGFLNLMLAVKSALEGAEEIDGAAQLALRDPEVVAGSIRGWSGDDVRAVRRSFRSFGCCGVEEPVADAVSLGLVGAEQT
jgi:hypothetical protein